MIRYGRSDCKHEWVYRLGGRESSCTPLICKHCGAFACTCDLKGMVPFNQRTFKDFFRNGLEPSSNINGRWNNPFVNSDYFSEEVNNEA